MASFTNESGMQILTKRIKEANEAIESGRKIPSWIQLESKISRVAELVDCLSSVSKSVFEHDDDDKGGGYPTTTLLTFLLHGSPRLPCFLPLRSDPDPFRVAEQELVMSEFQMITLLGLLGLISLHDTSCMSLPPLPLPEYYTGRSNNVDFLLWYLGMGGRDLVSWLLELLIEGTIHDKLISVMAVGAIAQQPSGVIKRLVEAGVGVEFAEILRRGPMLLQAEVAHVISKIVAADPTIQDQLPLHDLVGSLVRHLQLMPVDINKSASTHNSNKREIVDNGNEKSPEVKARMLAAATKALRIVNNDPSLCWIVVEGLKDVAFSLRCLGIDEVILTAEGRAQVSLLLNLFREGNLHDKRISVNALGVIAQESRKVEHSVAAGVVMFFNKILKEGPMLLQAEIAHVMSLCMATDPTFRDKLPLDDLVGSLVTLLQVEVAEEHLQDDINKATSVLSIVAARHNSNKRKVADDQNEKSMSGEQNQPQHEDSPQIKDRMREAAAKLLGALAKDNASACQIIVEKRAVLRFAVLLQNGRLDVKLSSAMALTEITAVAEKESDLRRSAFKHSSYAHKSVVNQLMRIIREALDGADREQPIKQSPELLIPCIKTIGNLAATFRGTQPIISLVHLLESSNYEVVKETLVALTKFACRDHNFLHLDHSKAIVSLGGLNCILRLAADEKTGVEKHAMVLLCYVAIDALGNESDELKKVVSAINLSSRKGHFSKDEAVKALLQQTKRKLGQLMIA